MKIMFYSYHIILYYIILYYIILYYIIFILYSYYTRVNVSYCIGGWASEAGAGEGLDRSEVRGLCGARHVPAHDW